MDIFAVLLSVFHLFAAPHGLPDKTANSLCNIYVLISDTRFRHIKGLSRIYHHPWHRTSPILPLFELFGLESLLFIHGGDTFFALSITIPM